MRQKEGYSDPSENTIEPKFHGSSARAGEPSSLSKSAPFIKKSSSNKRELELETPDLNHATEQQASQLGRLLVPTRNSAKAGFAGLPQITSSPSASSREIAAWVSHFEALFEAMSDGLSVFDRDGHLIYANSAAHNIFTLTNWPSLSPQALSGHAQSLDVRNEAGALLPRERWPLLRLLNGEHIPATQTEIILLHSPDTHELPLRLSGVPLYNAEDQIIGAVLISQNITALKEAEQLKNDLKARKEAEQLKDNFIAAAAHELRSPLTALMGYAEMLYQQAARSKNPELAEWQVEALEIIAHDTTRIVGLMNDLLDVTRLNAGQLPLRCYHTNLVALVHRVVTRLNNMTKQHTLVVESSAPYIATNLDVQRMEQVVTNLVNNAIKYSPNGGKVLLTIQEDASIGWAVLSVRDHGIGIPISQQRQIFNRFFRATNATRFGLEGSGLGLYLSRELIRLHGGHIWFESVEGQGSTFFISLPLAPED